MVVWFDHTSYLSVSPIALLSLLIFPPTLDRARAISLGIAWITARKDADLRVGPVRSNRGCPSFPWLIAR
ncbi:hypothetical protein Misp02_70860 [Microtetraspora sp. NBRC 16547]|nr:hypothetical protein Misp02_70860 [Microtetraspora sp. NBRC 16547]